MDNNNTYSMIMLGILLMFLTYKKMISNNNYEHYKKHDSVINLKYNSFSKKARDLYKKTDRNINYNKNHISIFISSV